MQWEQQGQEGAGVAGAGMCQDSQSAWKEVTCPWSPARADGCQTASKMSQA